MQKLVEKGASKEKIGLRGPMPPGVLFAVYDSKTGNPDYIPPEYCDIHGLLDELIEYVNTTDDHPLIVAAVVHYQLVTIHPFEDGNGRTARLLSGYIMDLNGCGFNGIGSLEEYFAYDIDEYYESIQMGLPALYYSGRANPPHPEIWINYFLRMVKLYSNKVCDLQLASEEEDIAGGLSFLKGKEKELLQFLIKSYRGEFTPIEVSRELSVTNKTIINRLAVLVKNGFVVPILVNKRIRSYELSEFTRDHEKEIMKAICKLSSIEEVIMIRVVQKTDITKVADIWLDTNIKAHNFISAQYWESNYELVKEMLLQAEVYVCESNGEIQGFIGLNGDYIEGIFVCDRLQSQGIGKLLLDFVKESRTQLSLNVYQKNTRAIHFYQREGFEIQNEGLDEATGEKDYVMTWR